MDLLQAFLAQKGKEYAPFDPQRVHRIYAVLKPHLEKLYAQSRESKKVDLGGQNLAKDTQNVFINQTDFCQKDKQNHPFIIHILGTNGKGSTGRFITLGLAQKGHKVLHFTSPHLFVFNERFYFANVPEITESINEICVDSHSTSSPSVLNAKDSARIAIKTNNITRIATNSELESAHLWLQRFHIVQEASYFEYATFLALYLAKDCDYFVCEAGLGGEYDSTSVLNADLSVFTPISIDHEDFLGSDIDCIAGTKLRAMGQNVILAPQKFTQCQKIAQHIAREKNANLFILPKLCEIIPNPPTQPSAQNFEQYAQNFYQTFHCKNTKSLDDVFWRGFHNYITKNAYAEFLHENLFCAIFALLFCNVTFNFATLKALDLRGRCESLTPNILLDVGHNAECAHALKHAIVQKFGKKNIILVYNAYFDKAVLAILSILKPVISEVLILNVKNERIIKKAELENILNNLGLKYSDFTPTKLQKNCNYVVFGSFSVVAEFLAMQETIIE